MRPGRLGGLALLLLAVAAPRAFGLGSSSGKDTINPAVDFHGTLVDRDGTTVDCTRVNVGGEVQLEGEMGRGSLHIPFDNIQSVELSPDSRDRAKATVRLKSGDTVEIGIRPSATFYGHTAVGLYQIRARDLKRIDFSK